MLGSTFLPQIPEVVGLSGALLLEDFEFVSSYSSLLLDLGEEVDETLGVVLEQLLGATKTHLTHVLVLHQFSDFLVLSFNHVLDQEHFTLLLDKLPARFTVLRALDGNVHTASFRDLNFALNLRVNGQSTRFNFGFTKLS